MPNCVKDKVVVVYRRARRDLSVIRRERENGWAHIEPEPPKETTEPNAGPSADKQPAAPNNEPVILGDAS